MAAPSKSPTPRTPDEIVARCKSRADMFGFETDVYLSYLDLEHARQASPYVKKDKEWDYPVKETPMEKIHDYLEFAWEKANDYRGLSAVRSIKKFIAWFWLAGGYDEFVKELERDLESNFQYYGKDILVKICRRVGEDPGRWDDGKRYNSQDEEPEE